MDIWLHRISHCSEVSYKLLEKGYISIGFSAVSNEEFMNNTISGDEKFFNNKYEEIWGKKKTRFSLWRFLNEFKQGDLVLIPQGNQFSIYKIIGEPKKQAKNLLKISLVNNRSSLSSILNEINQELLDKTLSNNQTDITVSDFQKERFNSIKNKRAHLMRQLSEKHNDSSVGKSRRNNKDNVQETEHRNCKSPPINRSKTTLCKKEESKTESVNLHASNSSE